MLTDTQRECPQLANASFNSCLVPDEFVNEPWVQALLTHSLRAPYLEYEELKRDYGITKIKPVVQWKDRTWREFRSLATCVRHLNRITPKRINITPEDVVCWMEGTLPMPVEVADKIDSFINMSDLK